MITGSGKSMVLSPLCPRAPGCDVQAICTRRWPPIHDASGSRFAVSSRCLPRLQFCDEVSGPRAVREGKERLATAEITRLGGRFDRQHARSLDRDGWPSRWVAFVLYEDMARVTGVSLDGTGIVDDDLATLASLPCLEGLDISRTEITDAGVVHLTKMPNLKYVNAYNTKLTEAGVRELRSRRPSLVVDWR